MFILEAISTLHSHRSTARLLNVVGAGSSPRPALCPFNSAGLTSGLSRSGTLRPASATSVSTTTARSRTQTKSYCPGNQQTTRDKLWREASLITFTQRRNAVSVVITSGMGRELRDILVWFCPSRDITKVRDRLCGSRIHITMSASGLES